MARLRSVARRPRLPAPPAIWQRLAEEPRRLLAAFALHPEPLPANWLAVLTKPVALDALATAGLIAEETDGCWRLETGIERNPLRRLAPWSLRQELHRRLAELCQQRPSKPKLAAGHLESLGESGAASDAWLQEARRASRAREPVAAIDALTETLRLSQAEPSETVLAAAGEILAECAAKPGAGEALIAQLQQWLAVEPWADHAGFVSRAGPLLAGLLAGNARHAESAEVRMRTAAILRRAGDFRGAAHEAVAAASTLTYGYHFTAARRAFDEAIAAAEAAGDAPLLAQACIGCGLLLGMRGDAKAGRALLERALDIALPRRLTGLAAEAYRVLGSVAEYSSCYRDEQAAFSRALAYCRRHDATETADICLGCLSYSLFRSGNWKRSREVALSVLAKRSAPEVSRCVAEGVLGLLHAHRGEVRDAVTLLESSNLRALQAGLVGMQFFNFWGLALVEEQCGRPVDAALHYRRLLECWQSTEDRHDAIPGLTSAAVFFARQGDRAALATFAGALQKIAREVANPETRAAAAFARAEQARLDGDADEAVGLFKEALAQFARCELVVERVRVLLRLGAAQQDGGHPVAAQTAWREARQRARRLGARPCATEADAELTRVTEAKSEKPKTASLADGAAGGLSARQRDVVRHLSAGLTNKEIAARLGVSVRTIDMHVSHVLIRLDCRSRTEIAARVRLPAEHSPIR